MAGSDKKTKFTLQRREPTARLRDDFATVFADDFANRPAMPQDIPIDQIEPSPFQAREEFNNLEELAQSMREHGFTSRLRVRPHPTEPERYQLVYGERRLRAARMAGIATLPCDVAQHADAELREIGLTENIVREDLSPLEEARAFKQALDVRDDAGQPIYSIRTLAERIGKDKGYIQNRIKILETPADVQGMVEARPARLQSFLPPPRVSH
jgi:ParB family chromosome partitioning protein